MAKPLSRAELYALVWSDLIAFLGSAALEFVNRLNKGSFHFLIY
jgi:hypothetical protein